GETVIKLGTEHLRYIIPCVDNFHIIGCFALTEQWKLLLHIMMRTEFIINTPTLLVPNIGSQTNLQVKAFISLEEFNRRQNSTFRNRGVHNIGIWIDDIPLTGIIMIASGVRKRVIYSRNETLLLETD
ncbi:8475_t:CDS:2, partial [Funneliformis caledonium]